MIGEGLGDFNSAVGPEVVVNEGVALAHGADGLPCGVNHYKIGQILILNGGIGGAEGLDGLLSAGKMPFGLAAHH